MKLLDRIRFAVRVILHDLFGEEDLPVSVLSGEKATPPGLDEVPLMLKEAQAALDRLHIEYAGAVAYSKQCEQEQVQALAQVKTLDESVNQALQAGQDEQAREALGRARRLQQRANEAAQRTQESLQMNARLESAIREWQRQLDEAAQKYADLVHRQRGAEAMEEIHEFQQRFTQEMSSIQTTLDQRKEAINRRQDYLEAKEELRKSVP